jgi:tetratricopeptide (TPR) repeat protein
MVSPVWSGTILITSGFLGKRLWWDAPSLRAAVPSARFGSVFVFRGSFPVPGLAASVAYRAAIRKIYAEKPDLVAAEELLSKSARLDPDAFFVNLELGNVCLNRGRREDARDAYLAALQHAPTIQPCVA